MGNDIGIDETELGRQRAQLKKQKKEELTAFAKDNPKVAAQILALMSMSILLSAVLSESPDNPKYCNRNPNLEEANNQNNPNNPNSLDDETVIPTQPWL